MQNGDALAAFLRGIVRKMRRRRQKLVDPHHHGKGTTASSLSRLEISGLDEVFNAASFMNRFHQRNAGHAVMPHAQNRGNIGICGIKDLLNCGVAKQGRHPAVIGRGGTTSLDVAQDGDSRVFAGTFLESIGNVLRSNGGSRAIHCSFGNDDDRFTSTCCAPFLEQIDHLVFPAVTSRVFGSEDIVCAACDCRHQGKVTTVTSHDLDNEGALVRGRG